MKLLCLIGLHKKVKIGEVDVGRTVVNVWGKVLRETKCQRCGKYQSEFLSDECVSAEYYYNLIKSLFRFRKQK